MYTDGWSELMKTHVCGPCTLHPALSTSLDRQVSGGKKLEPSLEGQLELPSGENSRL